ncbi:putative selenium-dependent hydroxylase accessory protein YqeC [bacterium]|nr:putative selenium-dependent hydroxylase accessory protein YqeC [bacterium]
MDLRRAFDLRPGDAVALTGAGGKSGLMFALANELEQPVVLTTTTHLGAWQAPLAERHLIVKTNVNFLKQLPKQFKTLLLTGPAGEDDRLTALSGEMLRELGVHCRDQGWTLLIEADGARQRPLKAPAEYEPVVPEWVDGVIVVAGLSALGKLLKDETVHRPERFSALTGLPEGGIITVEAVANLLSSPQGGLKGFPEDARRWLFLNHADSETTQAQAQRLAMRLQDVYSNILIGSLHEPGQTGPIFSKKTPIPGVVLAAGGSRRLGRPKQLLNWEGRPFIRQVCLNALAGCLAPLIVITGAESDAVRAAVEDLPVEFVHNSDWEAGQATSLRAGLSALPGDAGGVMFLLSDQPQVGPDLINGLCERFYEQRAPITAPQVTGRRGNPVLFSRETFDVLSKIEGDRGGRAVFSQFDVGWLPWVDERILLDVDDEGDYERMMDAFFNF